MSENTFGEIFEVLRSIMLGHANGLVASTDSATQLSIEANEPGADGKALWYGGVQIKKSYVSYHLMPVYVNPTLLEDLTPRLRARMQGKSCFNFKAIDEELFDELGRLTGAAFRDFTRSN